MPNQLAHETSPYLLQNSNNPVDCQPWGPEAVEKSKDEGKPIFLSIGYSACHWWTKRDGSLTVFVCENFTCQTPVIGQEAARKMWEILAMVGKRT